MENVDVLEDRIANSNSVELEGNIMVQLGRFGALELFHACLSRTIVESPAPDVSRKPSKLARDGQREEESVDFDATKVIIPSQNKGKRKYKRERSLKRSHAAVLCQSVSSMGKKTKTRSKKETIFKNEAGMSQGVRLQTWRGSDQLWRRKWGEK